MGAKYWIKLYHEILDDPKMGMLPDDTWRLAIELFLLAGELDNKGALPTTEEIAWKLRKQCNETLHKNFTTLQQCNILTLQPDKTWVVTKFLERQAAVSGAERVRQHRSNQRKNGQNEPKTPPNPEKQDVTQSVTKRYTDTDTDTDTELIQQQLQQAAQIQKNELEPEPPPQPCPVLTALTANFQDWISQSLNGHFADEFRYYAELVQPDWVDKAYKRAKDNDVRKWSYIKAILDECVKAGRWVDKAPAQRNGGKTNGTTDKPKRANNLDERPTFDPYTGETVYPDGRRVLFAVGSS